MRETFRKKYALARQFRRELSDAEARLWLRLKGKPEGVHFRKQHPVGPSIVDFYCARAKLVIEVEGQIHNVEEVAARDEKRLKFLEELGLEVMRVTGEDIMSDPDESALGILVLAMEKIVRK